MTVLNDEISGTQGAMLDMGKEMMMHKAKNTKLRHELASLKASGITAMQGHTTGQSYKPHIKIAEPPPTTLERAASGLAPTTQNMDAVE